MQQKNDINFIHEMRMHDKTSNWFDTGKTTVYSDFHTFYILI